MIEHGWQEVFNTPSLADASKDSYYPRDADAFGMVLRTCPMTH